MKTIILAGMRATGALHLGHYHGVLKNMLKLQNQKEYQCFFFIADIHALTTHYAAPYEIANNTHEMLIDWLAAGVNPDQAIIFVQSHIPEICQLHTLLSMITPVSWLERVPTYKDQQQKLKDKDLSTFGFLGYPMLMTADILVYKARQVPVGADQISHLEISREIARRFNYLYGNGKTILPEPEALLTETPTFPGLDGQKMSKSYHNTINLREDPASIEKKIRVMPTDPARIKRTDAGDPDKCPVWNFHQLYSSDDVKKWVQDGCRNAKIGCLQCKQPMIDALVKELQPIRERAKEFENNPQLINTIVERGAAQARVVAKQTKEEVFAAMGLIEK